MPYLGPKSFKTTPLTSSNLAVLNNTDNNNNYHNSNLITSSTNSKDIPNNIHNNQLNGYTQKITNTTTITSQPTTSKFVDKGMQTIHPSSNNVYLPQSYTSKLSSPPNPSSNNTETIITNSSSNSTPNSINQSSISSETSYTEDNINDNISTAESFSYKTLVDVNDDDNKTVVLSQTDDNNLLIPSSPLKSYNLVSVSPKTSRLHRQLFEQSNDHLSSQLFKPSQSLHPIPSSSINQPSPYPLLRKKSGELIKSSLKLSNLQRSNSMPNAKSVRFATRLENVKFFKKSEQPSAVSIHLVNPTPTSKLASKNTKWDFDSSSCSSSENDDDDDSYNYYSNDNGKITLDYNGGINYVDDDSYYITDDDNQNDNFLGFDDTNNQWIIKSNDCPHNPDSLNFARLATNKDVILESVKLNSTGNALIGFVYAKNIAFEKKIIVRLSSNNWETFKEFDNSNYISSNHIFKYSDAHSNVYDKFSFIIKLEDITNDDSLDLQFCIQYITNNQSFWDNNNDQNYRISLIKKSLKNKSKKNHNTKIENSSKLNHFKPSLDLDDSNIKLKDNNNFKLDFSKPKTDINSLRTSNSFGLKKIKSESSLPLASKSSYSLDSSTNHNINIINNQNYFNSSPQSINEFFSLSSINQPLRQTSKSLSASPALSSTGFDQNNSINDYDNIIKKFCFFTTSDHSSHNNDDSNSSIHSDHSDNKSENNYNFIKSQYTIDNFNFSKSQTSIDLY